MLNAPGARQDKHGPGAYGKGRRKAGFSAGREELRVEAELLFHQYSNSLLVGILKTGQTQRASKKLLRASRGCGRGETLSHRDIDMLNTPQLNFLIQPRTKKQFHGI